MEAGWEFGPRRDEEDAGDGFCCFGPESENFCSLCMITSHYCNESILNSIFLVEHGTIDMLSPKPSGTQALQVKYRWAGLVQYLPTYLKYL